MGKRMTDDRDLVQQLSRTAAHHAGDVVELLDVLWEQVRNDVAQVPVSTSQLRLMYIVDREDGIRMRTVGKLLGAAPPSVCRLCDRLQALGFIERLPCPDSRREVVLRLTAAGRNHLARIRERREDLLSQAIGMMPAHQRIALAEGLAGFHAALSTTQPTPRIVPPVPAAA